MRRTLFRLVVAAAGLFAAVVGLEVVLRAARPAVAYQYAPQHIVLTHFATSEYLPFELKKNFRGPFRMLEFATTVATNGWGLRDRETDFSKPRILCLGDSFTFGFGVENDEAFCAKLEEEFGGRYDVVNAGIPGGSPDIYGLWLSRRYAELQPRLIIVNLSQNDLIEVHGHQWAPDGASMPQRIMQPGTLVTRDGAVMRDNTVARLPPPLRSLVKESYLVAIVRDRLLRDADAPPEAEALPAEGPASPATIAAAYEPRFTQSLKFIREAARQTPVVIHLIPSEAQAADSPMDEMAWRFAAEAGWPVVQEYGVFAPADHFEQDGHWLPSGHLKASKYLHAALVRLGF